eukprot:7061072-Pyramimonas_sp.AAC.2
MVYTVGIAASLLVLRLTPAGNLTALAAAVAGTGFFIYGPQMLIGLIGAEVRCATVPLRYCITVPLCHCVGLIIYGPQMVVELLGKIRSGHASNLKPLSPKPNCINREGSRKTNLARSRDCILDIDTLP